MKNLFNDPKLDKGFQIDFSKLNDEQKKHVLQIFQARGIPVTERRDTWHWLIYTKWSGKANFYTIPDKPQLIAENKYSEAIPIIDYATLCRGAVQLNMGDYTVFLATDDKVDKLFNYAAECSIGILSIPDRGTLMLTYINQETHQRIKDVRQSEFEQRLRGIYPVVKENQIIADSDYWYTTFDHNGYKVDVSPAPQEDLNEKPKYLKQPKLGLIVELIKEQGDGVFFTGKVVDSGKSEHYPVGYIGDGFVLGAFEPCDYTEDVAENEMDGLAPKGGWVNKFEEDSPAAGVPEPRENLSECISLLKKGYERMEHENASLGRRLYEALKVNEGYEKQIAELKAQLANMTSKPSPPKEPVYDVNWLNQVLSKYREGYKLITPIEGLTTTQVSIDDLKGNPCASIDPKASAGIILAALAKELNGDWDGKGDYWCITTHDLDCFESIPFNNYNQQYGQPRFKDEATAEKAIDILTQHFPEVLTNYFKP